MLNTRLFFILFSLLAIPSCVTSSEERDEGEELTASKDILEYQNAPAGKYYDMEGNPADFYDGLFDAPAGAGSNFKSPVDDFTAFEMKMKRNKNDLEESSEEEIALQELQRMKRQEERKPLVKRKKATRPQLIEEDPTDWDMEDIQAVSEEDANWNGLN